LDPILLARAQFALTVMFHFLFPAITIGLGLLIVVLETLRWRTGREVYDRAATFWTKLFALTFAVGVATGVVMEFQFGTNWAAYSRFVGDIFGSPLAAEAIFAFFLESAFLGLLLFGRDRVSSRLRWFAALMVALGSTLSAFWIVVADSWMQTPAGYTIVDGRAHLTDFWAAVFNPSTMPRFIHTVVSAWSVGAFLMVGVAAWYLLRRRHLEVARTCMAIGVTIALVTAGLMFLTGDVSAREVAHEQAAKFAAMQGLYQTTSGADMVIFSLPPAQNPADAYNGPSIVITRLLSFLSFGSFDSVIRGLQSFPPTSWPPVAITFLAYHNMVVIGTIMLLVMLGMAWYTWRRSLLRHPNWLRLAVAVTPLPLIAQQLGWMTAEIGRQPWVVYDVMRTSQGVSTAVSGPDVLVSLLLLAAVYTLLGGLWLFLMRREILHGPEPVASAIGEEVLAVEDEEGRAQQGLTARGA
jgi:cytochrome bd ubiquinol oxidase subunit I